MPLLNAFKIHGDAAQRALQNQETLLALSPATVAYGVTRGSRGAEPDADRVHDKLGEVAGRAGAAVKRAEGRSRPRRGVVRALLAPFALFGAGPAGPRDFPESWFGGRTCEGRGGSAARAVQQSTKEVRESYLAVSDRRLLLLGQRESGGPMSVLWTASRDAVAMARRRPRLLARARLEIRFTDGSWVVLSAWPPNIGSWHAKQIVDALAR
ncbi:hypothetical protein [Saccharopolyspora sp. SCSIO 74807]|uniref:hypothetical protein n=1 Tax=Saccharopolyspora sp. SCSIO 74807 TaxID=3118084 RepID=UPI0030D40C3B